MAEMWTPRVLERQRKKRIAFPNDIILEILVRLPARSVGRFRCVSKSLLSFTTDATFIRSHMERSRMDHQSFILYGLKPIRYYLGSLNPGISLRKLFGMDALDQSFLVSLRDGLIVFFCWELQMLRVDNPLTGYSFVVPSGLSYLTIDLYFHHSTSEYRLLRVDSSGISDVLVVGQRSWRVIPSRFPVALLCDNRSLDVNGSLHWLSWKKFRTFYPSYEGDDPYPEVIDIIMTFDKETEIYTLLPLPQLENICHVFGNLVEFKGGLGFWVICNDGIVKIWIMEERWINRYSFNAYADLSGLPTFSPVNWLSTPIPVSIRGEELLMLLGYPKKLDCLVRWNLKSGSCIVQEFNICIICDIFFPYEETLVIP